MFGKNNKFYFLVFLTLWCLSLEVFSASGADNPEYTLRACTRRFSTIEAPSSSSADCFDHCYVQLVRRDRVMDSRGFFADRGSIAEPDMFDGFQTCQTVRRGIRLSDWRKVTAVYDGLKAADYSVTAFNCCTCCP